MNGVNAMPAPDCIFCKIVNGELPAEKVYEDDRIIAFKDISPKAKIHILAVPRQHITSLATLQPDNSALISHLMMQLSKIAREQGLPEGFRTVINTGPAGGQLVNHLHAHILGGSKLTVM